MPDVHSTAIIDKTAQIADSVIVGPQAIIGPRVVIGERTTVGPRAYIEKDTRIGDDCRIHSGAVLGTDPQDLKYAGEETTLEIGSGTVIREFVTINRGTSFHRRTVVGDGCLFMAYAHVAHDCIIGNNVILANAVNLGGHVTVEDYAIIGGLVGVHQFTRVGSHSMAGGGFRVTRDVCPYSIVAGYPLKVVRVNVVGLKRRGFPDENILALKRAFKVLFFSNLNTRQAIEKLEEDGNLTDEVKQVIQFFRSSRRGVVK